MSGFCQHCGEYLFFNENNECYCKPFEIECENGDYTQYGYNFEDVALKWARKYNENGDYNLMNTEIKIIITDKDNNKKTFIVGAEPDIHYYANDIEDE